MEFYNAFTTVATGLGVLFVAVLAVAPSWMEVHENRRTQDVPPSQPAHADLPAHPDQYDRAA